MCLRDVSNDDAPTMWPHRPDRTEPRAGAVDQTPELRAGTVRRNRGPELATGTGDRNCGYGDPKGGRLPASTVVTRIRVGHAPRPANGRQSDVPAPAGAAQRRAAVGTGPCAQWLPPSGYRPACTGYCAGHTAATASGVPNPRGGHHGPPASSAVGRRRREGGGAKEPGRQRGFHPARPGSACSAGQGGVADGRWYPATTGRSSFLGGAPPEWSGSRATLRRIVSFVDFQERCPVQAMCPVCA